jgi:hypothetical protein
MMNIDSVKQFSQAGSVNLLRDSITSMIHQC